MHILVTGGLGFIGSNFIRLMLDSGYSVTNLDNLSYGSSIDSLRGVEPNPKYRLFRGDICDAPLVEGLVKDVSCIVNFAAQTHVDRSISDPMSFYRTNVGGVVTLLEAVRKSGRDVRLVQIGTDESYGDTAKGSFREADRLSPSSPYSASKASADLYVLSYRRTYGIDAVVTRCTNNFGPFQSPEKLIPKTIIRAEKGLKVPVYGTGSNVRDWIYVEDHCRAVKAVMESGSPGEIYNISAESELDNLAVIRKVLRMMSLPETLIEFVEDRPGHDVRYSLDSGKLRADLGWRPLHSFDDALSSTDGWYLGNEWWWGPLADERTLSPAPWKLKW
jgi:dTDP-glucose 4,6-dehydratase